MKDSTLLIPETTRSRLRLITAQLKETRRDSRLTQEALGAGLGVSLAISSWERGVDTPSLPNFLRWAETLGFTAAVIGAPAGDVPVPRRGEPLDQFRIRCLVVPLRVARENADLTQEQVGDLIGVSSWSVHMWEAHWRIPRLVRLIAWCHALDCDLTLVSR